MNSKKMKAPCTILLLAANVAVFFLLSFQGATEDGLFMLEHGAMYVLITEQGEYYRMFTSMFLHFGFEHLFNNYDYAGIDRLEPGSRDWQHQVFGLYIF